MTIPWTQIIEPKSEKGFLVGVEIHSEVELLPLDASLTNSNYWLILLE